jgi:dihydrofolate reductase (trimethoprim resistance protein)
MEIETPLGLYKIGTRLRKKSGASWQGKVVGYYSTALTPVGYAIESEREPGSVQIYPATALEHVET